MGNKDTKISYHISMPEPHTHYYEVEMTVSNNRDRTVQLKMPVWTPGSYLVREFARTSLAYEPLLEHSNSKWTR